MIFDMSEDELLKSLDNTRQTFLEAANAYQKDADTLFDSLPYDDRLKVFCAVVAKIAKGELDERGTYRHVLYDTFQFDYDSYAAAQFAGYMDLHNSIYGYEDLHHLLTEFAERLDVTDDNLNKQVEDFLFKRVY